MNLKRNHAIKQTQNVEAEIPGCQKAFFYTDKRFVALEARSTPQALSKKNGDLRLDQAYPDERRHLLTLEIRNPQKV